MLGWCVFQRSSLTSRHSYSLFLSSVGGLWSWPNQRLHEGGVHLCCPSLIFSSSVSCFYFLDFLLLTWWKFWPWVSSLCRRDVLTAAAAGKLLSSLFWISNELRTCGAALTCAAPVRCCWPSAGGSAVWSHLERDMCVTVKPQMLDCAWASPASPSSSSSRTSSSDLHQHSS